MRKIIIGLIVLIVVLVGAIAILPQLIPSSVYKDKIQTQLANELGRDVVISGDVKLAVFPTIKAKTGRVEIANAESFSEPYFAAMEGLDAKVKLLPLLSKRVEIAAFTLNTPVINLRKNGQGESNWLLGKKDTTSTVENTPEGPFKRDGRYAALDPQIGLFVINNGAITYKDATSGADYDLSDVNIAFTLPGLTQPVKIDGDLKFNGDPMDVTLTLDTPRDFLDGREAPVTFDFNAPYADLNAQGKFLTGQDIAFDMDIIGEVMDIKALTARLPMDIPYADVANKVELNGNYLYDGTIFSARNADIKAQGAAFDAAFNGDAAMTSPPSLSGNVNLNISDVKALAKAMDQDIVGLELADSVNLKATLVSAGKGFSAENIDASIKGDGLTGTFTGTGAYGDTVKAQGNFTSDIASIPVIVKALKLDMPEAAVLGSVNANGRINLNGKSFNVTLDSAETNGEYVSGTLTGKVTRNGEAVSAVGNFDSTVPSVTEFTRIAGLDVGAAKAVGRVTAKGEFNYQDKLTKIDNLSVVTDGGDLAGRYDGSIKISEAMSLNGAFDARVDSLMRLSQTTGITIPYATSIGQVTAKGTVSGNNGIFDIAGLDAQMINGQINGRYQGAASTRGGFNIDGQLNADIPSIRAIAAEAGTQLPPSTQTGAIYENFAVSGRVNGTPTDITFKQANLTLDQLKGRGDFAVDLKQTKPFINGTLNLEGLDLRPYMASYAAQNPTGKIQPWSEEPLNVSMLNAVDVDLKVSTPNIVTDRMSLGQSDIDAKIRNGVLTANMPNLALYGGAGRMTASLDASGSVPTVALDVNLADLSSESFLGAVAGFTKASGDAGTALKIRGSGHSQAAIMKSLTGSGDFKVLDGQIAGVDLSQFLTGLDTALSSRTLPSGIGSTYVTKFKDIAGLFTIENGVARVNKFSLDGLGVLAEGEGQIDLGNQAIDFSLRPRLTGESASDLAAFGIPIRFQGTFGGVSAGLDTDLLGKIVAEKAKARAHSEITKVIDKNVGGDVGGIIGGIIGGGKPTPRETPTPGAEPIETSQPQKPEDAIGSILGGILKTEEPKPENTSKAPPQPTKSEAEEPDPAEILLKGLFGRKKEKPKPDE